MSIDWAWLIVPAFLAAWLLGVYLGKHWHDLRDVLARAEADEEALRREAIIRQALNDEAEYLIRDQDQAMRVANSWPCAFPPCDFEDNYRCSWHDPRGQRLQYGPEPVIGRCEWSQEMEGEVFGA